MQSHSWARKGPSLKEENMLVLLELYLFSFSRKHKFVSENSKSGSIEVSSCCAESKPGAELGLGG